MLRGRPHCTAKVSHSSQYRSSSSQTRSPSTQVYSTARATTTPCTVRGTRSSPRYLSRSLSSQSHPPRSRSGFATLAPSWRRSMSQTSSLDSQCMEFLILPKYFDPEIHPGLRQVSEQTILALQQVEPSSGSVDLPEPGVAFRV